MIKEFLQSVLSDTGFYCVLGLKQDGSKRIQKFYDNLDAAAQAAQNFDEEGFDAYFGLATFVDGKSRKQENVHQLRSFFLDLDCGPFKEYPTQQDALVALKKFCKDTGFPKPTIVNSGRGIHVYWPLAEPIGRDEWVRAAEGLKQLCKQYMLHADPVVTADSARILRVPGTKNYKDTPPNPVNIIGGMGQAFPLDKLESLIGGDFLANAKPPFVPKELDAVTEILSGSYASSFKKIVVKTVNGHGCAQIGHAITNQESISEPMWRATLSIAAFCADKDKAIHRVSNKHPDYDPQETENKVARIKGPYTCAKFEEYNPGGCDGCPNKGKFKSPIILGREVQEADESENVVHEKAIDLPQQPVKTYVIPKYPAPFFRGANGGVFKRAKNKEGDPIEIPIYHNDLYVVRRLRDPEAGEALVMRLHLPKDGVREFTVPLTSVLAKDEFRKNFAAQGVAVMNMDGLMEYVTAWVNDLQTKVVADEARTQFGWVCDPHSDEVILRSFVLGEQEIFHDRIELNAPSSKTVKLMHLFKPRGTLEAWKETINFFNQPNFELHQYMFGISVGAPLMRLMEINGAVFHIYSKGSGFGKTTAMYAGASVWGMPDELVLEEKDTFNSKMNRAEIYKNLPLYMDEMTNTAPKDLSDFGYSIPTGKQKNRLGGGYANTERHRGEPWHFLCGTTGNTSMIERISLYKAMPKAEAERILEYRVEQVFKGDKELTDTFFRGVKQIYGHAGPLYIQYILQNQAAVKKYLFDTQKKLDATAGLKAGNRFWSAQGACVLTGLTIMKKLGLIQFDLKALFNWLVGVLRSSKETVDGMGSDVQGILTEYLAQNYNNVLRIKSTDDARHATTDLDHLIIPDATPRVSMVARYEYDIKKFYFFIEPLKEWCGKKQIDYGGLIEGLRDSKAKGHFENKRMGKGTRMNLPPKKVLVIDGTSFMDDEIEQVISREAASTTTPSP